MALLLIYICYYFNFNYLLGIIILLLSYIIVIFTTYIKTPDNILTQNKQTRDKLPVTSSKPTTMIYKNKYNSIYQIIVKLDCLIEYNQPEYYNAIKNLNTFLYLLQHNKTTNTQVYTLLKDNRDQLLNKLKACIITIPIENKKLIRFVDKKINKLLIITQYYLDTYSKKVSKEININYPVYNNINDPQPNPLYSMDYSNNYTLYS